MPSTRPHRLLTAGLVVGLLAGCGSSGTHADRSGSADFVGFKWRITEVRHDGIATAIPAAYGGSINFGPDHLMYAD